MWNGTFKLMKSFISKGEEMTKQKPKYKYLKVLQGYYSPSYGWEDLVEAEIKNEEEMRDFRQDIKDYEENEPYPHRVIKRRVLNEDQRD